MSSQHNQTADEMSPTPFEWQLDPVQWQASPDHDVDEVAPGPFDWQFEPAMEPSFVSWDAAPCEQLPLTEIFHGPGDVFYNPEATLHNPEDIFYNPEGTLFNPEELFYGPEARDIFYHSDSEEIFHAPGHEFYNPEGTSYNPEQDIFLDPGFMPPGFYRDPQPGWFLAGLPPCPNAQSGPFRPRSPIICYGPPSRWPAEPVGSGASGPLGGPRSPEAAGPATPSPEQQQPQRPASCPPALMSHQPQEARDALRPFSRG